MRHKSGVLGQSAHIIRNFFKRWRVFDHLIINPRQLGDKPWNPALGIDETLIRVDDLLAIVTQNGNFGNAARIVRAAGGFNIYNGKHKRAYMRHKNTGKIPKGYGQTPVDLPSSQIAIL